MMPDSNHKVIFVVTSTIAILAIMAVATICLLSYFAIPIPPELNTLAGGLVGAISAMLVKTTATSSQPNETKIINEKSDPIPTKPQK